MIGVANVPASSGPERRRGGRGQDVPQAVAAEECLIALLLVAAPTVVARLGDRAPSVADYYDPRAQRVAKSIYALVEDGTAVSSVAVEQHLADEGQIDVFRASGGILRYCLEVQARAPLGGAELEEGAGHIHEWARAVTDTARRRRALEATDSLRSALQRGDAEREELARKQLAEVAPAPTPKALPRPAWPTPAERALQLGLGGVRMVTPFPSLNTACRGGVRTGTVVVIGGAPGAGKTTSVVQMGLEWARNRVHVAILAADEDADGLLIRVGQMLGLARENLEEGVAESREALASWIVGMPLMLVDADEQDASVDDVSTELALRAAGKPSVLVVDSIQTVRCKGAPETEGPRARVDAVMATLKRAAKSQHHLVIATCELARGAYRSAVAAERIDDLAAFKESGGVEYGASLALVMRSVPGTQALIDVSIAKNRLGEKLDFRLALDKRRASLVEVQKLDDEDVQANVEAMDAMKKRVLVVITKSIEALPSKTAVWHRCKGNKQRCLKAIFELEQSGEIHFSDRGFRIGSLPREPVPEPGGDRPQPVPAVTHPQKGGNRWNRGDLGQKTGAPEASVPEPINDDVEPETK